MQVRSYRAAFIYNVKGCITTSFDCDKMFYGTFYLISVACYEAHEKSWNAAYENSHSENVVIRQHSKLLI